MSVPELVRERLDGEEIRGRVSLGGDDELLVTSSRTLIYRAEGLLSGESIEEYPHAAERVEVRDGRRKSTIRLDHGIEGESEFTIPKSRVTDALGPVLEGVLSAAGVTGGDESVEEVYRLGELTLCVTDARVVKHVGNALWDEESEEYAYERVTGLDVEEGDVSSEIVIAVDGRPQRIKAPSDDAREIRERIERALLAYHGADTYAEFKRLVAPEGDGEPEGDLGDQVESPEASEPEGEADDEEVEAPSETIGGVEVDVIDIDDAGGERSGDVADEVAALRDAVRRQNEILERHQETIETLIEELRRGR